jgi:hypothetical protein
MDVGSTQSVKLDGNKSTKKLIFKGLSTYLNYIYILKKHIQDSIYTNKVIIILFLSIGMNHTGDLLQFCLWQELFTYNTLLSKRY